MRNLRTFTYAFDHSVTYAGSDSDGDRHHRSPAVPAAPLQAMLVALNDKQAWRITVGSCAKGSAKVTITTDGSTTWADAKTSLATIMRVPPIHGPYCVRHRRRRELRSRA